MKELVSDCCVAEMDERYKEREVQIGSLFLMEGITTYKCSQCHKPCQPKEREKCG